MTNDEPKAPEKTPDPSPMGGGQAPLQFDRADFGAAGAIQCVFCKAPISGEYFHVNDKVVCPACREKVSQFANSSVTFQGILLALAGGLAASLAGIVLFWISHAANIGFGGLISILVGWMVGYAVRWASQGRGGLLFQALAVGITFLAISARFVPFILGDDSFRSGTKPYLVKLIIAYLTSLSFPFIGGAASILTWVFMGFALYQAWIMTRRTPIQLTGPFYTSTQSQPPPIVT